MRQAKALLELFCLQSNTIGCSGHMTSTIHKVMLGLALRNCNARGFRFTVLGLHTTPSMSLGRMTGAFTWPTLYDICHKMPTKPINMRATTTTCTGCVRCGMALLTMWQQKYCRRPTTQHNPAEH